MIKIVLLPVLVFSLTNQLTFAGSATWNLNPATGDWNTAPNWTPATVPNGASDIATFAISNQAAISLSASNCRAGAPPAQRSVDKRCACPATKASGARALQYCPGGRQSVFS